ncbi:MULTISPECIES: hypothetical protein [Clostridium]|jgi:hypothetical protein|nr:MULTISPECIES: hypothetical protein [Clostridium]MDF2503704.1 hypothetical protein [Clostridium sp.]
MDNKNVNKDVKLNKNLLDDEKIFVAEDDEIVINCEGQPCNFSYFEE